MPYQSDNITNRPLRVFLCHSSNDKPAVRELYQKLRAVPQGDDKPWIQPWLDEEELYPGQDWNMEIEKAIEETDVILVCLSNNAITKEGYVQREIRIALDYADYKPEGTLFIIPVRLEECKPPKRLLRWQYADYFEGQRERGIQRLLVSLHRRAESLGLKIEFAPVDRVSDLTPSSKPEQKQEKALIAEKPKPAQVVTSPVADTVSNLASGKQKDSQSQSLREKLGLPHENITKDDGNRLSEWIAAYHENIESLNSPPASNKLTLSNGMELIRVPAGMFLMGSRNDNKLAYNSEKPQLPVDIPYDYWMARYPVPNELYSSYVKSRGIKHPVDDWQKKKDHPVVYISWKDAMGYCQWLNNLLKGELPAGLVLRLPTETEWEKAARGIDGREYPWGNTFDKNKCNTSEGGKGDTTPVGLYSPQGDSPYGCADMSGGVWEWAHSLYKPYPYQVNDGREYEKASGARVVRGGSFFDGERIARCACRGDIDLLNLSDVPNNYRGFRVVASPVLS